MSLFPVDYLRHILVETEFIIGATEGISEEYYSGDETRKRAIVRSIEIIGEAAKQLPPDFRARHPHVDWKSIGRMRDRLIHGYFGVDDQIVWDVPKNNIPTLREEVLKILERESQAL